MPIRFRPPRDIPDLGLTPGQQERFNAWLRVAFTEIAEDMASLGRSDAPTTVAQETIDVAAGSLRRVTPPVGGMTVRVPAPTPTNAGQTVRIMIEAPVGDLTIVAVPGIGDDGKVFQPTINGASQATFSASGLVTLTSNGSSDWKSASEFAAESPASLALSSGNSALDAQYLLRTANSRLPNARVADDSTEIDLDYSSPGLISWFLKTASVAYSKLVDLAGLSVLGRAANTSGVMAAITAGTIRHVVRDSDDGTSLEWGFPCAILHNGASLDVPTPFFSAGDELNSGWFTALGPSAIYVADTDTTIVSWFSVGSSGYKNAHVAAYDHATDTWSARYIAGNFLLADDDHGQLALCRDADGYIYAFYGSHATAQPWSISTNPDDITAWTQQPDIANAQTYPHPVFVSGVLYLFSRVDTVTTRRTLAVRTATPASGLATFTTFKEIVDFDADSRVYQGEAYAIGSDIHFVCTRANATDTARKHVYYFVYKTATGAIENHDGSVSVASGSQPVSLATANAGFRLFDSGSGQGEVPSLCFDSSGDPHILFADDGGTGTYELKHIKRTSGTWSSPVTVAGLTDYVPGSGTGTGFVTTFTAVAGASGSIEAWFINAAGDKQRAIRSSSGTWGSVITILAAGAHTLLGNTSVRDASADMRVLFCENSSSSLDSGAIAAKRYAYGDSGPIDAAIDSAAVDSNYANVSILLGFESRDAASRVVNEADATAFVATIQGNAQIDTAQSKFGSGSLLLDGTGDYITFPNNSLLSVSNGDFTVECFIRRNGTSKLQAICTKRPASGTSEFACYINVTTNVLVFQGFSTSALVLNISGTTAINTGTWYHVAFTRSGTTWRIFLDGALEAAGAESASPSSNSTALHIGRDPSNSGRDFNGHIDEFRFTSGVARYTAAFTAPSAAFPRI